MVGFFFLIVKMIIYFNYILQVQSFLMGNEGFSKIYAKKCEEVDNE